MIKERRLNKANERTTLEYWLVLYRGRRVIFFVTIMAMLTAGFLSKVITPVYMAKATFFVPSTPDVVTYHSATPGESLARRPLLPLPIETSHAPYIGILKSGLIAELVQKDFPHKSTGDLRRRDVDFSLSNEFILELSVRDKNPEYAAGIANAYVEYLNQSIGSFSLASKDDNLTMIEEEIKVNRKKLFEARHSLKIFQEENMTANLSEEIRQLISLRASFLTNQETVKVEQQTNDVNIDAIKNALEKEADIFKASDSVITSPLLEEMKKELTDMETKMAGMRVEISNLHPDVVSLKTQYDQIEKNINTEISKIVKSKIKAPETFYENLRQQLISYLVERQLIQARVQAYDIVLKSIEERLRKIPELMSQEDVLSMEIENHKTLLSNLVMNKEEVKMQGNKEMQVVVLVDKATPPTRPSFPLMWINILIAGSLGLIAGIFYSFLVDYIEQTRGFRFLKMVNAIEKTKKE